MALPLSAGPQTGEGLGLSPVALADFADASLGDRKVGPCLRRNDGSCSGV
jgi:hypothetical protein